MDASSVSGQVLLVGPEEMTWAVEAAIGADRWRCVRSPTPSGVLSQLRINPEIDAIILAPASAPGPYIELCRHVKFDARTTFVSVLFVLPPGFEDRRADIFAAGADDCIQFPAPPGEIVARLSNAYRLKHATDSLEDATAVITSLANAVEGRDAYTRGHVERVSSYSVEIGRRLAVAPGDISVLSIGGVVHDIGKVAVPDQILNKPGKLTPEEMALIKRHPIVGYDILQPLRTFRGVLPLVRWHHEHPNGTGYPDGVKGDDLPLLPRIVAVADVFDALSTARSYRAAFPPAKYRAMLQQSAANEDLDPQVVGVLLEILDEQETALAGAQPAGLLIGTESAFRS